MKKIVCPTDFSETADQAIAYAAALSKKIGAELTLLHVQSVFSFTSDQIITPGYSIPEENRSRLKKMSYQVMDTFKISCISEIEEVNNDWDQVLASRAKEFDLIVMGTNGADDYYAFFFGSQSYQLARDSSIPVLLIPSGCEYRNISSVLFAFDYEHEQELPMRQLSEFFSLLDARVTVLQVKPHYKREAEINSEQIEERAKLLYNMMSLEFDTVYSDDVEECINNYMATKQLEVLALCSIQYNIIKAVFHKSLIKLLSSSATYPLFIFHG